MTKVFIRLKKSLFKPEMLVDGKATTDLRVTVLVATNIDLVTIVAEDWTDAEQYLLLNEIDIGMIFDLYLKTRFNITNFPTPFTWNDLNGLSEEWVTLTNISAMSREIKFGVKRQIFEPMKNYKERVYKFLTFPRIAKLISSIDVDKIMTAEIAFHDTTYTVRELAELRGGFSTYQMDKLREIVKQNLRIAMAMETKAKLLDEIYNKEEKVVDTESGIYEIPEGFRVAGMNDGMHVITKVECEPNAPFRYGIFNAETIFSKCEGLLRANKK